MRAFCPMSSVIVCVCCAAKLRTLPEGPAHFELMQLTAAVLHLLYQRLDRWLLLGKDFLCLRLLCVRQVKVIGEELKLVFTEHSTAVHVSTFHRLRYGDCCSKRQNAGDN